MSKFNSDPWGKFEQPIDLRVGGRLCLFGEHSDWAADYGVADGHCIVAGTEQGIRGRASRFSGFRVESLVTDPVTGRSWRRAVASPWDSETLRAIAHAGEEYFRHCAGVACQVAGLAPHVQGINVTMQPDGLPIGKGVASSASVCVLIATAFARAYDLKWGEREIMELAYLGERQAGSKCGRMDQACIFGRKLAWLRFRTSGEIEVEDITPGQPIYLFFVDLAGRKDTIRILNDLHRGYLRSPVLQRALGEQNKNIVRSAVKTLIEGNASQLGVLMSKAQALFDEKVAPYSPKNLRSPLLHELLSYLGGQSLVYGGKGVGSQGDGTAQFVARDDESRHEAMARVTARYPQMRCFPLTLGRQ
ncbi:MAG: GHMP kinase [Betaproteobacteria bacterium]|nr:GHMP kinase [Betaproteobacteria bacterium]